MRRLGAPLLVAAALLAPSAAAAQWLATAGGAGTITASTMTGATGFVASCEAGTSVRLTWTISPDAFVEGYQILRSRPGVPAQEILALRTTATYLDTPGEAKGQESFTYTYTIRAASRQHAWTTPAAPAPGSITLTKNSCTKG